MSDIISPIPASIRRFGLPRLRLQSIGVGTALGAMARLLGHAFTLAYVAPYTSLHRQPPVLPDDPDGRDPNW